MTSEMCTSQELIIYVRLLSYRSLVICAYPKAGRLYREP